jgi:hypothetical protein
VAGNRGDYSSSFVVEIEERGDLGEYDDVRAQKSEAVEVPGQTAA